MLLRRYLTSFYYLGIATLKILYILKFKKSYVRKNEKIKLSFKRLKKIK